MMINAESVFCRCFVFDSGAFQVVLWPLHNISVHTLPCCWSCAAPPELSQRLNVNTAPELNMSHSWAQEPGRAAVIDWFLSLLRITMVYWHHFSFANFSCTDRNLLQLRPCGPLQYLPFTLLEKRPNLACHTPVGWLIESESGTAFGPKSNIFQNNLLFSVYLSNVFAILLIENSFGFSSFSTS